MTTDLELYKIFVTVAKAGSFSAGAKELFLTQPAVSQAMQKLEQQLGARLFVRAHRGVTLTAEGQLLFQHALSALQMLDAGEQKLRRVQTLKEGQLRLGAADTITKEFLLPYLSAFHQLYPGVQLQVTNRTSRQLAELLKQEQLDIAILNLPIADERLLVQPIWEVHDVFVAGHRFENLSEKMLTPRELAEYPLVMLERSSNSRCYVDDWFAGQGVRLTPEIELGSHELLPSFAAIGFGLACVVQEFCQKELKEGVVFPLSLVPPIPTRSIGACWVRELPLSSAAGELMRLLNAGR